MPTFDLHLRSPHSHRLTAEVPSGVAMVLSLLACVTLDAAPLVDDVDEAIDEIQVTATRRPVARRDASAALTIVAADTVREARLVTDALAAQPGVFLQQTTPGQGAAIVRGLKGSEVLHLVDGFRLNNAIFRNAPTQYLALVSPGSVERLEVLRGASASLYGNDAVGGVVQVVSRMPALDDSGTRGDAYFGFASADLAKIVRGSLETGNERYAALLSGEYLETGNRRTGAGARVAPSGFDAKGLRLAVQAKPSGSQTFQFDLQYAEQPSTPRVDEMVPGFGQTEPASSEFWFEPNDRIFAQLRYLHEDGWWSADWTVAAGWQSIADDRRTRDFESPLRRFEHNRSDLFGLSVTAAGTGESGAFVVGAELYTDEVRSSRRQEDLANGQSQELASRFPDRSSVDQAAVFGNLQRYVGERHRLAAGLRVSAVSVDIPDTGTTPAAQIDREDVSADLGWIFDATDATQVVANLAWGFRAPNVFDLGTLGERPGNRFNIPNTDLESERITQVDFGVRHRGTAWTLDAVLYALHYTDRIASVLTGAVTPAGREVVQSRNVATADIFGLELRLGADLSAVLSADLILNAQRGEQEDEVGVTVPADRMPPLNGRALLRYRWTEQLIVEPYVVFAAGQDRLSPRDVTDSRINPDGTPGWFTANVAMSWQVSDRLQLRAAIENIFDRRYRLHGSGIDALGVNLVMSAALRF